MPRLQTDNTGFQYLSIPTEEKPVKRKGKGKFWNKLVKLSRKRRLEEY